ncbi:MAG: sugar ABC transporter permease [Lachnospiraceae bacterium]|nr:sugar ABC transporter permease [Lachnospiraceae bacterium]
MKQRRNKAIFITLFLIPACLCFLMFYAYPILQIVVTSFCKWDYTNLSSPQFYGVGELLTNYKYIFTEYPYFWEALKNSLCWALVGVVIQVPLTLVVAIVLSKGLRFSKFARNVYIVPSVISSAAMGLIFLQLYNARYGPIQQIIQKFNPDFTDSILLMEGINFWAIVFAYVFFCGTTAIMLLGQIHSIAQELYEAGKIDGAKGLKRELYITIPLVMPTIKTVATLAATSGFLLYNEVFFLTNGAAGTKSITYIIRELAITSSRTQYARANTIGVVQIVIGLLLVAVINFAFSEKKIKNRGGEKA